MVILWDVYSNSKCADTAGPAGPAVCDGNGGDSDGCDDNGSGDNRNGDSYDADGISDGNGGSDGDDDERQNTRKGYRKMKITVILILSLTPAKHIKFASEFFAYQIFVPGTGVVDQK